MINKLENESSPEYEAEKLLATGFAEDLVADHQFLNFDRLTVALTKQDQQPDARQ